MSHTWPSWAARSSALLTRDFCPGLDRYLSWLRRPLVILLLTALSAALCGVYVHPMGFTLLYGVAMVIVLGLAWPAIGVLGLRATLAYDAARAREGQAVKVRLRVRNRLPWASWGVSLDLENGHDESKVAMAHVPGRRTTELAWEFVPPCRGVYPRTAPVLRSGFPFGLWQARRSVVLSEPLLVWPRTYAVGRMPSAAGDRHFDGVRQRNQAGTTGDVLGTRPYRAGDPLRRIHWGQTARHDRLIACELQTPAHPCIHVIVDGDPTCYAGAGPQGAREWALRVAASFIAGWTDQGAFLQVVLPGPVVLPASGPQCRHQIMDALARFPATCPPLAELLQQAGPCGHGMRLVITSELGLLQLPSRLLSDQRLTFVLLCFGPACASPGLTSRPWLTLTDPAAVPAELRRSWKEVSHAC
jgi:uncharacterized protein (DUF58 family)